MPVLSKIQAEDFAKEGEFFPHYPKHTDHLDFDRQKTLVRMANYITVLGSKDFQAGLYFSPQTLATHTISEVERLCVTFPNYKISSSIKASSLSSASPQLNEFTRLRLARENGIFVPVRPMDDKNPGAAETFLAGVAAILQLGGTIFIGAYAIAFTVNLIRDDTLIPMRALADLGKMVLSTGVMIAGSLLSVASTPLSNKRRASETSVRADFRKLAADALATEKKPAKPSFDAQTDSEERPEI